MVWRIPHEEFDPKSTIPMIKQSGGSVMIWGCFTRQGVGKLCVSWTDFTFEIILEQNLQLSIKYLQLS